MNSPIGFNPQRLAQIAQGLSQGGAAAAPAVGAGDPGASFGSTLKRALGEVSETQEHATDQMNAFLRGEPVELHQVMAAAEEAGIALELLVEVRNKFTEAYRTVINMQS